MTATAQPLTPDTPFGQHRIIRLLGCGGMGEVYEVEHELTGKRHALKLLNAEVMEQEGALDRFRKEAKVMARLEHAGIVRVDFAGEDEGRHWLRMELMTGRVVDGERVVTLEDYLAARGGRLPEVEVQALVSDLLNALGHSHAKGLVHRDLKPANVLFNDEEVKISDFGLVNAAGADWMETQVRSTVINPGDEDTLIDSSGSGSRQRALMGTYAYMSPEQREGLPSDARSDVYTIGLMTFRMLTGQGVPGMKRPSELGLGLNTGWDAWLIEALENEPSERFASADAMRKALGFDLSSSMRDFPEPASPIRTTIAVEPDFHEVIEEEPEAPRDPELSSFADFDGLERIAAQALPWSSMDARLINGEMILFENEARNPYSGWVSEYHENGQLADLAEYKMGKQDGRRTRWYPNAQKKSESQAEGGRLITASVWKPNGQECPVSDLVAGYGTVVFYSELGQVVTRRAFENGVPVTTSSFKAIEVIGLAIVAIALLLIIFNI